MTEFKKYVEEKGLNLTILSQQMRVSRQAVFKYGIAFTPTVKTMGKIAKAMTELGVKTEVVDLVPLFYENEEKEKCNG